MKTNNLTIKQEAFCQAYIRLGEATAAYKQAGYSWINKKDKLIHEAACRILKNSNVSARIKELQEKVAKIAEEKFNITAEEMLRHLDILRNARIDEYVTFVYEKVEDRKLILGEFPDDYEPTYHEEPRVIFKPFNELTKEQLMCIESIKVNRYGEVELKLHGKEWTIEKINRHIGFYEKDNEQKTPGQGLESREEIQNRIAELLKKKGG
jgi:phage terminase small subunit